MSVTVGRPVPAFTATSTAGEISLSDYAGKTLILYFYPKDATPGCTTQGQNFRDSYDALRKANADILGISRDSIASHQRFRDKMGFQFDLIADTDEALCALFDVIKPKKLYGKVHIGIERSTFIIAANGILLREWRGVKVPGHVQEVLEYVQSL
jgi:thioredoxin-dependent peroxiredoxin